MALQTTQWRIKAEIESLHLFIQKQKVSIPKGMLHHLLSTVVESLRWLNTLEKLRSLAQEGQQEYLQRFKNARHKHSDDHDQQGHSDRCSHIFARREAFYQNARQSVGL